MSRSRFLGQFAAGRGINRPVLELTDEVVEAFHNVTLENHDRVPMSITISNILAVFQKQLRSKRSLGPLFIFQTVFHGT
jgi:hypothetical protein